MAATQITVVLGQASPQLIRQAAAAQTGAAPVREIYRRNGFVLQHMGWDDGGGMVLSLFCPRYKCVWCRALVGIAAVFGHTVTIVDVDLPPAAAAGPCAQLSPPPAGTGRGRVIFYYCFCSAYLPHW